MEKHIFFLINEQNGIYADDKMNYIILHIIGIATYVLMIFNKNYIDSDKSSQNTLTLGD